MQSLYEPLFQDRMGSTEISSGPTYGHRVSMQCLQVAVCPGNTNYSCNVSEDDMIFMHRESDVRGAEAKEMMVFVREVQDTKWEWVWEVPKEEAPKIIYEPAKVPKPWKGRREPSPFKFEKDPMTTLEEPPIKRKKTSCSVWRNL